MRRRQWCRELLEQRGPSRHDRTARVEEGLVPEPQLVARRLLLADGTQQAVALLERPAVRAQVVGVGGEARGGERVESGTPERRGADDEQHLLGREQHDPEIPTETARSPPHSIDPDPLAAARPVGTGPLDRDLENVVPDPALDPSEVVAPPDELPVGAGPVRSTPAEQRDRLEKTGLAGGVRTPDQMSAGSEGRLDRRISA